MKLFISTCKYCNKFIGIAEDRAETDNHVLSMYFRGLSERDGYRHAEMNHTVERKVRNYNHVLIEGLSNNYVSRTSKRE